MSKRQSITPSIVISDCDEVLLACKVPWVVSMLNAPDIDTVIPNFKTLFSSIEDIVCSPQYTIPEQFVALGYPLTEEQNEYVNSFYFGNANFYNTNLAMPLTSYLHNLMQLDSKNSIKLLKKLYVLTHCKEGAEDGCSLSKSKVLKELLPFPDILEIVYVVNADDKAAFCKQVEWDLLLEDSLKNIASILAADSRFEELLVKPERNIIVPTFGWNTTITPDLETLCQKKNVVISFTDGYGLFIEEKDKNASDTKTE